MSSGPDTSTVLPVTLLCGFLGAGKTTLLKHVLETKHAEDGFRCAVIVNDMASLNIDKSLIDQSALVQSDEVIAMQNGCFCCTLQSDLVDQIKSLCSRNIFDYMLIEASGVSEPSQIAPLFDVCDEEHDHEKVHTQEQQLGEVARLDTCVTVVDAASFHSNLDCIKNYENGHVQGTIAELLMEQVEYSNVIVLNKQDLVSDAQVNDILDRLAIINPKANVIKSTHSKVDVMDILNTHRFKSTEIAEASVMSAASRVAPEPEPEPEPSCCVKSINEGGKKCCKKKQKNENLIDTGLSQVFLGVAESRKQSTRHEKRFGITSFVYRARRPFHPVRLHDMIMDSYFISSETKQADVGEVQRQATSKQLKRVELMGELLRSKGFVWIASTHGVMGEWQQAGNVLRISAGKQWICESGEDWEGTPSEADVHKELYDANGQEYLHGDRRQELVFIGIGLKNKVMQDILDKCLLRDEEMELDPDQWEQSMACEDRIKLSLEEKTILMPGQTHEEFWGITLCEKLKTFSWLPPKEDEEEEHVEHKLQITQACMGCNPKQGERNVVQVIRTENGRRKTTTIAALREGTIENVHLSLVFTKRVEFVLKEGNGPVSLGGCRVMSKLDVEEVEEGDEMWQDLDQDVDSSS